MAIDWADVNARVARSRESLARAMTPDAERIAAVRRTRAAALAARGQALAATAKDRQLLVVSVGDELYGVQLGALVEVASLGDVTTVPGGPRALVGLINLRGEVRSVVDLGRLLGLPDQPDEGGYVLMLRTEGRPVGLRVRDVVRVQSIDEDSVRDASARNLEADVSCIRGVTPDGVILLDVGALLSTDTFREETRSCHRLDRSGD